MAKGELYFELIALLLVLQWPENLLLVAWK